MLFGDSLKKRDLTPHVEVFENATESPRLLARPEPFEPGGDGKVVGCADGRRLRASRNPAVPQKNGTYLEGQNKRADEQPVSR